MRYLLIEGIIRNKEIFSIYEPYPVGRHIRGAFGWIAKDMGLGIKELFPDLNNDILIFRDGIPICRKERWRPFSGKKTLYLPFIDGGRIKYRCSSCGDFFSQGFHRTEISRIQLDRKKGSVNSFRRIEAFHREAIFRLSIILDIERGERFVEDLFSMMSFVKEFGINIGKRHQKGMGHFILEEFDAKIMEDIEIGEKDEFTINFISDAYIRNGDGFLDLKIKTDKIIGMMERLGNRFKIDFRGEIEEISKTLIEPRNITMIQVIEDENRFIRIPLNVLSRGISIRFKRRGNSRNILKLLKAIELFYGLGDYIGLGLGEIYVN